MSTLHIPNNIALQSKPRLMRQLDAFQRRFSAWWDERGPAEFRSVPMYLRCPVGYDAKGWAEFRYVRPQDYRWGLFQTSPVEREISFGRHCGQPVWQEVPAEYAALIYAQVRVQADAEPGSVEQSHLLCRNAPSRYDLRNLYQFLLEEARHFWAMSHILLEYFGPDGEEEVEQLLDRCCGDARQPRLLSAFNIRVDEWLSYFIWCFLADRDGKYQLSTAKYGSFDPLARTAGFMLFEEPLHMAIGTHGIERVIRRTIHLMKTYDTDSVFQHGGIPLSTIQRYLNYWAPRVFDLFGNDESSRARESFLSGVRARPHECRAKDRYAETNVIAIDRRSGDAVIRTESREIDAINASMRHEFMQEVGRPIERWNQLIRSNGLEFDLTLPSDRFNRQVGPCGNLDFDPRGNPISRQQADIGLRTWLPTPEDRAKVAELMCQVLAPDQYAGWIDPPTLAVNRQPIFGFEYMVTKSLP